MRRRSTIVWATLFLPFMISALHSHIAYAADAAKKAPSSGTTLGLCRCVSPFGEDEHQRLFLRRCTASEKECQEMPCEVPQMRTWAPNASDCKGARPGAAPPNEYDPMTDFR